MEGSVNNVQDNQFHMAVLRDIKESIKEIQIPCDTISVIQKDLGSAQYLWYLPGNYYYDSLA